MIHDTIAAIATAPGQGGVGIVRISGSDAERVMMRIFRPAQKSLTALPSHMLTYGHVYDGNDPVDECMAVIMRAPRSYTREDVCEIQLHGGSYTCQRVLSLCTANGARLAEPGEFTRRAFINGRIDLSQAEAVMALISARGQQAHKAAMNQLAGGASAFIRHAADTLYDIAAGVAACIDYPEEIDEAEAAADILPRMQQLVREIRSACDERAARLIATGLQVTLCGHPNAGKSSLLNALLGEDRAIVTAIPGTTRDVVTGTLMLGGCEIHLTDTAGLRDTDDPVEQLGVVRSGKAMAEADVVVLVMDASIPMTSEDRELIASLDMSRSIIVLNKGDLPPCITSDDVRSIAPDATLIPLSAALPETLAPLKAELQHRAAISDMLQLTQPRHVDAAQRACRHLDQAAQTLEAGLPLDLCTVDLQVAQAALGEITGDQVEEKLLDRVFSRFCVGK